MENIIDYRELKRICSDLRLETIDLIHTAKSGHPGGSLSVCEILGTLYFAKANISRDNYNSPDRDRIVLSKGHAAPMLYCILAKKGIIDRTELNNFRQIGGTLQGHPNALDTKGVEVSTGPLGISLGAALGMALAMKDSKEAANAYVYAVLGDGELNEGCVWETAMAAAKFKADHLIAIVDRNGVQLDGTTEEIMPLGDLESKWKSFGWNTVRCDGHSVEELCQAIDRAKETQAAPTVILAETVKGKGVSFMEGRNTWHGAQIKDEDYVKAAAELRENEK